MIIGGGIGGLYVSLTALLMDAASSSQRGLVAGIQNIAWGIGYFIGPAVGGIAATSSFSATYMLCIIASIIGGTLTLISQYRISTD
jgi:DHA1 family tetracycline resistance protein-like MFS transporter